ncbi:ABC transporter ATP-binding protein [uncultured Phascolarctobacterium sp.]|uniref:ABC transporter ATP-binding protein n=1 Tax=Phascolarctobacterium sp. TaxID=2049039 RepID=UPI0025ED65CE|nr:ABC transporter ATP-binding protein [uncultured Phascolarctobacterium sp.]
MANTIIELKNLSIGYGNKKVLQDVNAKINRGEIVGIIGCNGAGKSTLLKTIRGLLPRQSGEVLYFDKALESFAEKELAREVAYLQQNVEVGFGYTGKDIVLAGRYPYMKWWEGESRYDEELSLKCMEYTGTKELADRPVNEVSGGQKQRILLAKVLAQQTPILFLDEPTTGLDMVYQEEIFRFSKALAEMGKTILMVVHELNLAAKYCSRIILLGEGTVIADGKPEEVLTEEILSRAYNAPVRVIRSHNTNEIIEISTKEDCSRCQRDRELLELICCQG